jgi:rare lipoprotein A
VIRKLIVGLCAAAAILLAAVSFLWALDVAVPGRAHGAEYRQCGIASHYGTESGRRTANGERFPTGEPTAAHRTLPFNTRVRVTDVATGRSVVVRVNDRGPFVRGRIIDLSPVAARALGMDGLARVCIEELGTSLSDPPPEPSAGGRGRPNARTHLEIRKHARY